MNLIFKLLYVVLKIWEFKNRTLKMKVFHSAVNCIVHGVHTYLGESYELYRDPTSNCNIFTDVEHLFWPCWAFYIHVQRV